jgi:O-antigen/teichoic acid export membrane protein
LNKLKKLAGQTAIYGLSSIVGRFLNYLLVPLHTLRFTTDQYGVITEMYAYVAFLVVLLTYGMETAFFRYFTKPEIEKENVYTTILQSLLISTGLFVFALSLFAQPIADALHYTDHAEYVIWFGLIVGLDAVSSIAMARLRAENKALKFAGINISSIGVNIALNLLLVGYLPIAMESGESSMFSSFYKHHIGVGYVFIANLVASIFRFFLLSPMIFKLSGKAQWPLWKSMIVYAFPLLIAGFAGIINETLDRILLKWLLIKELGEKETLSQLGIYGACYKVSIIITLFIQAFRYAAEPFFFAEEKEKNSRKTYALIMHYFVIVCAFIFLGVMCFIDVLKYFISKEVFWQGLHIVPILLFANIFLGIYYNLSIWYKLSNQTKYGAYIAIFGAVVTIIANLLLIPVLGYTGSAWATLICYFSMMAISFYWGQKHYPIPYATKSVFGYLSLSLVLFLVFNAIDIEASILKYLLASFTLLVFLGVVWFKEFKNFKLQHEN